MSFKKVQELSGGRHS